MIFLTLMLSTAVHSAILTDEKTANEDRWLALSQDVQNKLKALVTASQVNYKDKDKIAFLDKCDVYNPKDLAKAVQICVVTSNDADNSIKIEFRNPNNRFELEFSNLDINDDASDIKLDPYVEEFLTSCLDLVLLPEQKLAEIEKAILESASTLGISDMAVSNGAITYTYKNHPNKLVYKITGDLLEIITDFFVDSIDLNIPLTKFIKFETKKLISEIISHLSLMQRFALSDGEGAGQSIKKLDCEKIFANAEIKTDFEARMTKAGLKLEAGTNQYTVSSQDDGGKSMMISCDTTGSGNQKLITLTADYSKISPNIQPNKQTFAESSLYDFIYLVAAYFNEVGTFAIRTLSKNNVEESFNE